MGERDQHVEWVTGILRTYGVADHECEQIAEALMDDGLTAAHLTKARLGRMAAAGNEAELRWLLGEWLTDLDEENR